MYILSEYWFYGPTIGSSISYIPDQFGYKIFNFALSFVVGGADEGAGFVGHFALSSAVKFNDGGWFIDHKLIHF